MGAILGRFRKNKTTLEKLEELDKDIKCIEKSRFHTQQAEKKIIGQFILVSASLYIIAVILYYYMFLPSTLNEQLFYVTPFLLIPFVIWLVKRLLKWYYKRKIVKNDVKLSHLIKEKKRLLDQVMDTETYKVAKTILEKFAPDNLRKSPSLDIGSGISPLQSNVLSVPQTPVNSILRNRNLMSKTPVAPKTPFPAKAASQIPLGFNTPGPANGQKTPGLPVASVAPRPALNASLPMPRAILPRDRGMLDKMVDYLVGDGPSNRFALICKNCHSHNGMALPEEFEYIAFRCCYCLQFNPSLKLRPSAPRLEEEIALTRRRLSSTDKSSSESEKVSGSDTESEREQRVSKPSSKKGSDVEETPMDVDTDPVDPTIKEDE